ncbi:MAG TPA: alpha-amylase/4-alpha-glucanotransferase domain-containing protein [Candidatus Limnocylindrales bacterium]|nr:alpha-amylase/4-alpha-glucanotransferase domain-containing protein [Candidatus Limnocylindrales bacterium]
MTARISLALVVHNHQPVGNFGWVIEEVFEKAYEPLIGALEKHPTIRLALHYTGPLLEWMAANEPASLERLRSLVERDQVEILGGGMFEPILAALPERDRHGQLTRMRADIERRFGVAPRGAWLAERVWEPSLPADLANAGYAYTVLDDNHLRAASVPEDAMWGTYTTDDQGKMLTIFGTEKGLRYRIPWKPVDDLISYLKSNATEAGDRIGIMGDDGEKFGAWPGTHALCWGREAWIEKCFTALEENADWLTTVTPTQWMADHPPIGRVYIPTASYVEMTEWALPADEAPVFRRLVAAADEAKSPSTRFLRGGFWRNFQARYREINDLHKQMLRVSGAVNAMSAGPLRDRAVDHLYRAQSNDCYWHGLFGGIYIVHMRMATHAELIAASDLALADRIAGGVGDFDLDGRDEVLIGSVGQNVLIDPAEGAGIGQWDLRASRVALASVLRRRPEAYHEKLKKLADASGKELVRHLVYDDHERRSGVLRLLDPAGRELGDFVNGEWHIESAEQSKAVLSRLAPGLFVRKTVSVAGDRLEGSLSVSVEVQNRGLGTLTGTLELEWNVNLMGGGGNEKAYYRWAGREARFDTAGTVDPGVALSFGNEQEGVNVRAEIDPPTEQEWLSVDTVSNSESGYEKVHQGSCLTQRWRLDLGPSEKQVFTTTFRSTQSRDRSAEETESS